MTHRFCTIASVLLATLLLALSPGNACGSRHDERLLLEASGVPKAHVEERLAAIDRLAHEFCRQQANEGADRQRIQSLHAFLHRHVLVGIYRASASNVGVALDGGPFNCVAATLLLRMLCDRCDIRAAAMSTRGHVWCRVFVEADAPLDIESTCEDWFAIRAKYHGVPTAPCLVRHGHASPPHAIGPDLERLRTAGGAVFQPRRDLYSAGSIGRSRIGKPAGRGSGPHLPTGLGKPGRRAAKSTPRSRNFSRHL